MPVRSSQRGKLQSYRNGPEGQELEKQAMEGGHCVQPTNNSEHPQLNSNSWPLGCCWLLLSTLFLAMKCFSNCLRVGKYYKSCLTASSFPYTAHHTSTTPNVPACETVHFIQIPILLRVNSKGTVTDQQGRLYFTNKILERI